MPSAPSREYKGLSTGHVPNSHGLSQPRRRIAPRPAPSSGTGSGAGHDLGVESKGGERQRGREGLLLDQRDFLLHLFLLLLLLLLHLLLHRRGSRRGLGRRRGRFRRLRRAPLFEALLSR